MSQGKNVESQEGKPEKPAPTPLEMAREQQAMRQKTREVLEQRNEPNPEVPGQSSPSNIRKHPQRKLG